MRPPRCPPGPSAAVSSHTDAYYSRDHITIWRGLVEEKIIPAADAGLLPY